MEEGEAMGRRGYYGRKRAMKGREELWEGGGVGGEGLCRRENDTNSSNHLHT